MNYLKLWLVGILTAISWLVISANTAKSSAAILLKGQEKIKDSGSNLENFACSTVEVETLTSLLLKDLPDYANRVIQRTLDSHRSAGVDSYIILAGRAEYEPLDLPQIQYNPIASDAEQVFFTVLERHYQNNRKTEIETYHWLFLTHTDRGWYMVTMFSRFGSGAEAYPPTPPQETSNGIIGQAVDIWLKDCRAGTIEG